ncbi:MAG: hypothetical protein ABI406_02420 [Ktedonobacteraceae bacterium]
MSQLMEYDKQDSKQSPISDNYETGYRDSFAGQYGQKLEQQSAGSRPKDEYRLALAIVSLSLLTLLAIVLLTSIDFANLIAPGSVMFVLFMLFIGVVVINFMFNRRTY